MALVLPARNEERLLPETLEGVPDFVGRVYVVDDASTDGTARVAEEAAARDGRVRLLRHETNTGPGGAIITGYREALREGFDLVVVAGADNQMDLSEMPKFLDPLVEGRADYVKGNRFLLPELERMPLTRFLGNLIITALTKVASGWYSTADVVEGYTATTREAIERIDWDRAWKGYGYPMDFLIRVNAYGLRLLDVPRKAIYRPGVRQSQIKGLPYALRASPMLLRGFLWRLWYKYVLRSFHPLVLFWAAGIVLLPLGVLFGIYLVYLQASGLGVSGPKAVLCALLLLSGFQSLTFAMLFDMEASQNA